MENGSEHSHRQHEGQHAGASMDGVRNHAAHRRHDRHSVAMFRDKFWLSLALTVPVVLWSSEVQHWLGYTAPTFPGSRFIPAILGTVVFFYGGIVFIRGAWGELSDRRPGMMTLISLAIAVALAGDACHLASSGRPRRASRATPGYGRAGN